MQDETDTLDSNDDLDMSWINEEERIQNMESNYYREPMEIINAYFIYINQNQYIDKILCEKFDLEKTTDGSGSLLSKETLLQIIQTKKIKTLHSKYKLIDILQYHIDLEPEHIQAYSKNGELDVDTKDSRFFKSVGIFDALVFTPSIFIFHSINGIYFFFQEVEVEKVKTNYKKSLKSILKTDIREPSKTKKVKISTDTIEYSDQYKTKHRKTRKQNSND
jgi:hypothetical protein